MLQALLLVLYIMDIPFTLHDTKKIYPHYYSFIRLIVHTVSFFPHMFRLNYPLSTFYIL